MQEDLETPVTREELEKRDWQASTDAHKTNLELGSTLHKGAIEFALLTTKMLLTFSLAGLIALSPKLGGFFGIDSLKDVNTTAVFWCFSAGAILSILVAGTSYLSLMTGTNTHFSKTHSRDYPYILDTKQSRNLFKYGTILELIASLLALASLVSSIYGFSLLYREKCIGLIICTVVVLFVALLILIPRVRTH